MADYRFRRMTEADLPMVRQWLATPDAATWWGDLDEEMDNLAADLHEPGMRLWIVSLTTESGSTPFAFLQDYTPGLWPDHPFHDMPPGTYGIDQTIGVPEMIGRGHGSAFIRGHVQSLFDTGAPCVVTDPDPTNARAIRAYEKAGFTAVEERDTPWGRCLLMVAKPGSAERP